MRRAPFVSLARPALASLLSLALAVAPAGAQQRLLNPGDPHAVYTTSRSCDHYVAEGVDVAAESVPSERADAKYLRHVAEEVTVRFRPGVATDGGRRAAAQLVLRQDGFATSARLVEGSGDARYDRAAQYAVERAAQERAFKPLPSRFGVDTLPLVVSFGARAVGGERYVVERTDCPAWPSPKNREPVYPTVLRQRGISGQVTAQYMVDASGRVLMESARIISSTEPAFTDAVLDHLPRMRYMPAEVQGRKVPQLVEQTFTFTAKDIPPEP
jgi:TonB family protein